MCLVDCNPIVGRNLPLDASLPIWSWCGDDPASAGDHNPDNIVLILIWKQYHTAQTCVNHQWIYRSSYSWLPPLDSRAFVTREPGIWGKSVLLPFWMTSQSNCTCRRPLFCRLFHDVGLCQKSFPSWVYKIWSCIENILASCEASIIHQQTDQQYFNLIGLH